MKAMGANAMIVAKFQAQYAEFTLHADLELPAKGVTVLSGVSGSGKTTLLRAMAGLERHTHSYFAVDGEVWQDESTGIFIPTYQRPLGYVFQEPSLFAHLSVRGNLEFGRRRARNSQHLIDIGTAIDLFGIGHLLERSPSQLSGGERQRVAIARVLASNPELLLLDEPLAALDFKRKQEILPYLEQLRDTLDIPIIYVTHSADELARLADHVVVLEAGRVVATGSLADMMARLDLPSHLANDLGVIVDATVTAIDTRYGLMELSFSGGTIQVVHQAQVVGSRLRLRIRARDVSITLARQSNTSILNQFCALVVSEAVSPDGAQVMIRLTVGDTFLLAQITRRSRDELLIAPGTTVWLQVKAVAVLV